MSCKCDICKFSAKVESVMAKLSREDREVIEELLLKWEAEATDAGYYEAILRGDWPGLRRNIWT